MSKRLSHGIVHPRAEHLVTADLDSIRSANAANGDPLTDPSAPPERREVECDLMAVVGHEAKKCLRMVPIRDHEAPYRSHDTICFRFDVEGTRPWTRIAAPVHEEGDQESPAASTHGEKTGRRQCRTSHGHIF
jgi:hypothetical protein